MGRWWRVSLLLAALLLAGCGEAVTPTEPEASVDISSGGLMEKLDAAALTTAALADESGLIVVGSVQEVRSYWLPDQSQIVTEATVAVEQVVAPEGAVADTVAVVVPGGAVGEVSQESEDAARLQKGQRLLLFLQAEDGAYKVVGGFQGAQPIEGDLVQGWEQTLTDAVAEIRAQR